MYLQETSMSNANDASPLWRILCKNWSIRYVRKVFSLLWTVVDRFWSHSFLKGKRSVNSISIDRIVLKVISYTTSFYGHFWSFLSDYIVYFLTIFSEQWETWVSEKHQQIYNLDWDYIWTFMKYQFLRQQKIQWNIILSNLFLEVSVLKIFKKTSTDNR